jgi:hypothetical protein
MMNHSTTSRGLSALLIALLVALAAPAWAGPPTDFVKQQEHASSLRSSTRTVGDAKRTESDARRGPRAWSTTTSWRPARLGEQWAEAVGPDERKEFIALLERLVELNYANRFQDREALGPETTRSSTRTRKSRAEAGKQAIVKTVVTYGEASRSRWITSS